MGFDFIKKLPTLKKSVISIPLMLKFRLLKMQEIKNCVMFLPESPINSLQSSVLVQQIMKMLFWTILPDYAMFRRK
mgnify:FL=1